MGVKLISPPATTPITLAEAKAHLRVVDNDDDAIIGAYIEAATKATEAFLGRALIDQTWELALDSFPPVDGEIKIPKPPLIAVTQLAYDATNGIEQIVDPDDYYVDNISEPGWIVPVAATWPTPLDAINSVRVQFRAGYLDNASPPNAAVPGDIKAAIFLTLGLFYAQRESAVIGTIVNRLPFGAEELLRQHRVLLGMA